MAHFDNSLEAMGAAICADSAEQVGRLRRVFGWLASAVSKFGGDDILPAISIEDPPKIDPKRKVNNGALVYRTTANTTVVREQGELTRPYSLRRL